MQTEAVKRLLVGRPRATAELEDTLLSKKLALPVFASDPLSSVAYATESGLVVLVAASAAAAHFILPISVAIGVLLAIVVLSYRQTVQAYQTSGGAYVVAQENLGTLPSLRPTPDRGRRRRGRRLRPRPRLRFGSGRAHRRRGDLERRQRLPPAEGQERRGDAGRARGDRDLALPGRLLPRRPHARPAESDRLARLGDRAGHVPRVLVHLVPLLRRAGAHV